MLELTEREFVNFVILMLQIYGRRSFTINFLTFSHPPIVTFFEIQTIYSYNSYDCLLKKNYNYFVHN